MKRIQWLEERGASFAAMSGIKDGDCACPAQDSTPKSLLLNAAGYSLDMLVCPPQVHGNTVLQVGLDDAGKGAHTEGTQLPEADGLLTQSKDIILGITIADCVPVFLLQPELGIAALLHAGREGTLQNICAVAVTMIKAHWGDNALQQLYAYIGPSAGPCCYEVSEELAKQFSDIGLPVQGRNLDLWQANIMQLKEQGILLENIACAQHCTICMGGYHSYRAHKTTARNIALLKL